jgi:hypothetical protein
MPASARVRRKMEEVVYIDVDLIWFRWDTECDADNEGSPQGFLVLVLIPMHAWGSIFSVLLLSWFRVDSCPSDLARDATSLVQV